MRIESFLIKILIYIFIFILCFIILRTLFSEPKIQKQSLDNEVEYITRTLNIVKEQMLIIGKSLKMQRLLEIDNSKNKITNELNKIKVNVNKNSLLKYLNENKIINTCSYTVVSNTFFFKKLNGKDIFKYYKSKSFNIWEENIIKDNVSRKYKKRKNYYYSQKFDSLKLRVNIACEHGKLNPHHSIFEKDLRKHLHINLLINPNLKSTKMAFFWINPELKKDSDMVLYEKNLEKIKEKYNLGNLSNVKNIPTGNLTLKEILKAKNKNPIEHKINSISYITWIIELNEKNNSNKIHLMAYSVQKEELENKHKSLSIFLLPETILAISLSFIIIFFLLRQLIMKMNKIIQVAKKVKQGEKNIRSNIKGNDDVGILGESFDSMLDFFDNHIKTLDDTVRNKTEEISKSLQEKETLLKEIHHRVKNNLALTIAMIELQARNINDLKTKKILNDIKNKIFTMELLHRKLYSTPNLNEIVLKNYIKSLVDIISSSYEMEDKVSITLDIEDINLNIEYALPLGLIINELLTNSYKYAFSRQKKPKIVITVNKISKKYIISIKDNGTGLESKPSIYYDSSLGLRLVNMIVKTQLFGEINYVYENGANFIITANIK